MKISDRLRPVTRLFLDTAPVIYFVEKHPRYLDMTETVFDRLDSNSLAGVTSPVTLAESLVVPYRLGRNEAAQTFTDLIVNGSNVSFVVIDQAIADKAAELRARYNLLLPDSFQLAVALHAGCDAFLTNDADLKRITEIDVLVLDDLEPD
jgi:predicted nucleic acid-binding protein